MTIVEYLEYDRKMNENHISNTKSYLPTYFDESIPNHDPILEFTHYFGPSQPGVESDYDSKDMEEEVEYMTDNEVVITNVSDEVSFIASNDVDKEDNNTSNNAPCLLSKELSPGSFLLPFNIDNHNFYVTTTLDAKDNIMPQKVYAYLGLDKLRGIDIFSYKSPACLQFEQKTRSYGTLNPQDEIAGPVSLSPDSRGLVKRWHVCKPVHVTYDDGSGEDCGMWLTCDPDSKFCFGYNEFFGVNEHGTLRQWICFCDHERRAMKGSYMGFANFLQVRYGQHKIDDTTRERSYDVKEKYAKEIRNPYSRRFDEYNKVFNNEIEQLSNEYILRIGKKGYVLDDVWERCE
ncbi:hypothetical protein Tco_1178850 [Tanacetum coccineum]